jgi:hypothetical protein
LREHSDLARRYHACWLRLKDIQSQLRRTATSDIHVLLGDVPPDWADDSGPMLDQQRPVFADAREGREAVRSMLGAVLALEGRAARLDAALAVGVQPIEAVNRLIMRLFDRVRELEQKVEDGKVRGAGVRAAEAIAANPGRSDRAIAKELGISKDSIRRARDKLTGAHMRQPSRER